MHLPDTGKLRLKAVLEAAHNAIVAVDAAGRITHFNPAAQRITGVSVKDAVGRYSEEILLTDGLSRVVETGVPEYAKRVRIGAITVLTNRTPIIADDRVIGAVAVFQDITEIEAMSAELQSVKELNRELDGIIESVSDGLYITDGDGTTLRINSSYQQISGVAVEEVIGRNMKELVAEGYYSKSVTLIVLEKREAVSILHTIKGNKVVLVTGRPVFDENGDIFRVVTTVRDMDELNGLKRKLDETLAESRRYKNELQRLRQQQRACAEAVCHSTAMEKVMDLAVRMGPVRTTVLITGESGVGKEVVASTIHESGLDAGIERPLIKLNCGAIPENLLESELFGYEAGAFTGATRRKPGLLETADGGSLFLDEVGEITPNLQVKLLRVLQEKEITRLGGVKPIRVDVRIIAATNRDLAAMVANGNFRDDLYYRLSVVPIHVPPLRERKDDILPLADKFLDRFNRQFGTEKTFSPDALRLLVAYEWPGNVRELENNIERLVILTPSETIHETDLPDTIRHPAHLRTPSDITVPALMPLPHAVEEVEKQLLTRALSTCGSTREVAKALGVSQPTVVRKLHRYGLGGAGK